MEGIWKLGLYIIFESTMKIWSQYSWAIDYVNAEHGPPFCLIGMANISKTDKASILILSNWKVKDEVQAECEEESQSFYQALPEWDKTIYWLSPDVVPTNCRTGKQYGYDDSPPELKELMEKAGFVKKEIINWEWRLPSDTETLKNLRYWIRRPVEC